MKISKLQIKDFKQFKNIDFDLTYPDGHERQGKPLDKVCFIGQSGTGKTNLLNFLLQYSVVGPDRYIKPLFNADGASAGARFVFEINDKSYSVDKMMLKNKIVSKKSISFSKVKGKEIKEVVVGFDVISELINRHSDTQHLYFFPAAADFAFAKNFYEDLYKSASAKDSDSEFATRLIDQLVFCHQDTLFTITSALSNVLEAYQTREKEARVEATYRFEQQKGFDLVEYLNKWRVQNPNPIDNIVKSDFSKFINNLNVSLDFNKESLDMVYNSTSTKIKETIRFADLSSGARQLLIMMMPLLVREPKNSILFIDEPENSLFPDVQRELIQLITSIGSNNQYFFATHSPIVAASFEPSERFFLFINESGEVDFTRGISPEGDDPNDLLINDFGLTTVLGLKGVEMYERLLKIKMKFEAEKHIEKKMELANELMNIASAYGFNLSHEKNSKK